MQVTETKAWGFVLCGSVKKAAFVTAQIKLEPRMFKQRLIMKVTSRPLTL